MIKMIMNTNQIIYNSIKFGIGVLILIGTIVLILGITQQNKSMITVSMICIIAAAISGTGLIFALKNKKNRLVTENNASIINPLMESQV